jgi:UDP-N-acetylglucosamine acyltransferase
MVGMGSVVTKPVPPYAVAYGSPARVTGANVVGMRRAGLSEVEIEVVTRCIADGDRAALPGSVAAVFAAHAATLERLA